MWGLGTTQIVILRTFRPIILRTNCGKLILGKTQLWYFSITIFWQIDSLAKHYFILWQNDILAKWYCGKTILWQHDILAKGYFGKAMLWQNDIMAKQYFWQNDILTKQYFGKAILWQNNTSAKWYLGIHTGRFPNKHTVQSKRFCKLVRDIAANWMAEKPPIQRSLIFTGKTAARTSWSKQTPQEPELCATKSDFDLLVRLRRVVRCAKGGARLGCVLSSRVPGRRDAAVHEHALKSCAAHTGFPCKDRSAKLEFEIFWSWKPCQLIFLSVLFTW